MKFSLYEKIGLAIAGIVGVGTVIWQFAKASPPDNGQPKPPTDPNPPPPVQIPNYTDPFANYSVSLGNDLFGIKKLYPDSQKSIKPSPFFMGVGDWKSRAPADKWHNFEGLVNDGTPKAEYHWKYNENVRINVYSEAGIPSTLCDKVDLSKDEMTKRGFMYKETDWKNVECTVYMQILQPDASDTVGIYVRGGSHHTICPCEGTKYEGNILYSTGNSVYSKKIYHNNYAPKKTPPQSFSIGSIIGKWCGMKFIYRNLPPNGTYSDGVPKIPVKLEIWVDYPVADIDSPPNNWRKMSEFVDNQNWFKNEWVSQTVCPAKPQISLSYGAPIATLRGDATNSSLPLNNFKMRYFSIREINETPL